jgi:alpha/beta superfamily hydrolase
MNMPKNTAPLIQGAAIGAIACAVLGFTWGGWVTGATARQDATRAAHKAAVTALAPVCARSFRAQGDAAARLAELAKVSTWERSNVVEKSGFATLPGGTGGDSDLAQACAELLLAPAAPKT